MEKQPPIVEPRPYPRDDEISLVDLTKILIVRWQLMATVFIVVVLAALAYALWLPRSYEYVSLYQVAEQPANGDDLYSTALETPQSVLAKIDNLYLGPATRELLASADLNGLPFQVSLSHPEGTLLVRLSTVTPPENTSLVESLHGELLRRIESDQNDRIEQRRSVLEQQLDSIEVALGTVQQSDSGSASELVASYTTRAADLQSQLSQLREARIEQVAVQSLATTGTSRSLIMALALVLGGMLAVISAFFMHFVGQVRQSLDDDIQSDG
ncbi:Wzz/FepE/Etk N-terminal domain-containing protein [Halomonas beimenensis]|uniref:Polysaccharide chain length determinant N-terminal domain-containing protein n=1 Tax=Halomonas beimenensis TaxID=475662 RepID=A0A291P6X1_9GAMM|nr:Wzz/FepE/Etk N-terminal domain-containing protein [Halomonas beimenensis]ATJ82656.1 hypothetical protein BEI_1669 [Halomonas beimenensis]